MKAKSLSLLYEPEPLPWLKHPNERRAFSFFLERSAPILSGALDYGFWSSLIPRMAESNMVIRYAIFAMSHFWEHPVRSSANGRLHAHPLTRKHLSALDWHSKALSASRSQSDTADPAGVMLQCTLLSGLEFQQNNFQAGLRLIHTVFTMLAPLLTVGCHGLQSTSVENYVDVLVHMTMRSSSLVFTSWDDLNIRSSPRSCLDDLQTAVFNTICIVYAGLKDAYLAQRSNAGAYIDRLLLKFTEMNYSLRSTKYRLGDMTACVDEHLRPKIKALRDYCDIGLAWLDSLSNSTHLQEDSTEMLANILNHAKTIEAQAHLLYPTAASTNYFHQMAILPPAYLVVAFAPNADLRADALKLTRWKTKYAPDTQLHAIVISLELGYVESTDPPLKNMSQVYHGQAYQPQMLHKVYQIPIQQSAPTWQPPEPLYSVPIQTLGFMKI